MSLTLEVIKHRRQPPTGGAIRCDIGRDGGTIGRSGDNDLCLPDDSHYVSSHHATIDFHAGSYYLIDVSMNGVYVNDATEPVGSGRPQRLFDGDRLRIGEYVLAVQVDEFLDEMPKVAIGFGNDEDLIAERTLLDSEATMRVKDFPPRLYGESLTDTVVLDDSRRKQAEADADARQQAAAAANAPATTKIAAVHSFRPPGEPARQSRDRQSPVSAPAARAAQPAPTSPPQPAPAEAATSAEVEAFLQGLGLTARDLGGIEGTLLLRNAGIALRELVGGSMLLLRNRSAMCNMFEAHESESPTSGARNPLTSAASPNYALRNLLTNRRAEDMPTADSIRDACRDLKQHEIAMFCAMRDAFRGFTEEIDPEKLERGSGRRTALLGGVPKSKCWDTYTGRFATLTAEEKKGKMPGYLGEQFTKAYEKHLQRLRRDQKRRQLSTGKKPEEQAAH